VIERPRIETDEQDLVQATVVADDAADGVHGIGGERPATGRQIRERDDAPLAIAGRVHEPVVGLRTGSAGAGVLRMDEAREREPHAHTDGQRQKAPTPG
jgi:hypothetical protein